MYIETFTFISGRDFLSYFLASGNTATLDRFMLSKKTQPGTRKKNQPGTNRKIFNLQHFISCPSSTSAAAPRHFYCYLSEELTHQTLLLSEELIPLQQTPVWATDITDTEQTLFLFHQSPLVLDCRHKVCFISSLISGRIACQPRTALLPSASLSSTQCHCQWRLISKNLKTCCQHVMLSTRGRCWCLANFVNIPESLQSLMQWSE